MWVICIIACSMMQVLITAGPTREHIDPVRYISNHSSGKMGIALADEFALRGWQVVLVKGPTLVLPQVHGIKVVDVESAAEMFEATSIYFQQSDVVIFAAAVADYTPKYPSSLKIKKKEQEMTLELVKTVDIAGTLGKSKRSGQTVIGFALETDHELENAEQKLAKKNFDAVVLNSMQDAGAGFQYDTNRITIIDNTGNVIEYPLKTKAEVAKDIADYVLKRRG